MHDFWNNFLDLFRDLDGMLDRFVIDHGPWVYALLFAIIFVETGFVLMPFLPGDSLLFAAGAIAARGLMNVWVLAAVLIVAAVAGDTANYHIGKYVGPRIFSREQQQAGKPALIERLLNRKHLDRAHEFFDKYGGKAVILARFVPIVRTFVPFVAGAGAMTYSKFILYNVVGGSAWVCLCVAAGYWFGNIAFVQKHFEMVVLGIIAVSLIPIVFEYVLARRVAKSAASAAKETEITSPKDAVASEPD